MTGLAGSSWRFDDVAGVPVGPVPDHVARERAVLELLGGAPTLRVDGDVLVLVDAAGRASRLTRARADPVS